MIEVETAEWMSDALCLREGDPDDWHPDSLRPDDRARTRAAQAVCSRCPMQARCLEYALEHNEAAGIWGGTTPYERVKMRKTAHQRAVAATYRPGQPAEKTVEQLRELGLDESQPIVPQLRTLAPLLGTSPIAAEKAWRRIKNRTAA